MLFRSNSLRKFRKVDGDEGGKNDLGGRFFIVVSFSFGRTVVRGAFMCRERSSRS